MVRRLPAVAVLGLIGLSCHTITEDLPTSPVGTPSSGPIPVIVVPLPVLTPTPPPAATPTPPPRNPSSDPTPAATPPPASGNGCGLSRGSGSGNDCPYERARFQDAVEQAIDNVIRKYPSLFDMRDNRCPQGCPRVLNSDGYWDAVVSEMSRMGYCATSDGEELAVKNSNSFNDQYDIISGDGYIRRGAGSYRSTCYPAWF